MRTVLILIFGVFAGAASASCSSGPAKTADAVSDVAPEDYRADRADSEANDLQKKPDQNPEVAGDTDTSFSDQLEETAPIDTTELMDSITDLDWVGLDNHQADGQAPDGMEDLHSDGVLSDLVLDTDLGGPEDTHQDQEIQVDATDSSDETTDTTTPPQPAPVLNEVGCYGEDFVEVFNRSTEVTLDLSGYVLSEGVGALHQYTFPPGTKIPPLGWTVVVKSSPLAIGFPFGLECGDDVLQLLAPDGSPIDEVSLPLIMKGNSYSRLPDGEGQWAESAVTSGAQNQPKPDLDGVLFDPTQVITITLEVPESSVESLWLTPDVYVPATFALSSATMVQDPIPIGIRLKGGSGTLQTLDQKPAFKLKFNFIDPELKFMGLKKLTLNNMVQDASMIAEVLSFEVFRAMNVPCARAGYAQVTLNGELFGVYLVLEAYDDVSMSRFFKSTLHVYEGDSGVDVLPNQVSLFDVDEGSETNKSDLTAFAIVASTALDSQWITMLQDVADLSELVRMWAGEHYIGHWDGYSSIINNYYLHSTNGKKFTMLPSGTDRTFASQLDFHEGNGYLFTRCMAIAECRAQYDQALAQLLPILDSLDLAPYAQLLSQTLAPWIASDPRMPFTLEEAESAAAGILDFVVQRPSTLEEALLEWLAP